MKDASEYRQQEKGTAIVSVVLIATMLLVVSIAGITIVMQQTKLSTVERHRSQAFSVAEAGLEKAIWLVENQSIPESEFTGDNQYVFNGYNSQGRYDVTVTRDVYNQYHYTVQSNGAYTAANPDKVKKVAQELYYLSMQQSIFSYASVNGGGAVTGNVELRGPLYCAGDLNIIGTTTIKNPVGTTGNPVLVRGNVDIGSNAAVIGGDSASVGEESPMAVFIRGTISDPDNVHDLVSTQVPLITLPAITPSRYLDAAEANDFAVYNGNLELGNSNVQFGQRADGTYTFDYDASQKKLTVEGVVYIDGTFKIVKQYPIKYYHPSGYTQATIFVNGQIIINDDVLSGVTAAYPKQSMLSLINTDVPAVADDISISFSGGQTPTVDSFLYTGGTLKIYMSIRVNGAVVANQLNFENVPEIYVPMDLGDNYPQLFPGKEISFVATSKWREVP